jgi:hypothetical protein
MTEIFSKNEYHVHGKKPDQCEPSQKWDSTKEQVVRAKHRGWTDAISVARSANRGDTRARRQVAALYQVADLRGQPLITFHLRLPCETSYTAT